MHQLPQGWFTPATPGFNLVDEPWIMVQDRDGSFTETSLRGLAAGSRRYLALASGDALCDVAVLRLLISMVCHATQGPMTAAAWRDLLEAPSLEDILGEYLTEHHDAFWLYHPTRGYAQAPVEAFKNPTTQTAAKLSLTRASGARKQLFDQSRDSEPMVCPPAEAARLLTTIQAYATTGGQGYGSSRIAGGELVVSAVGQAVHDTVILNTPRYEPVDGDDPSWVRIARGEHPIGARPVTGLCDLYTRRPRQVHLMRNVDGDTGWILFAGSERIPGDDETRDPMLTYQDNGRAVRAPEVGTPLYTLVPAQGTQTHTTSAWLGEVGALDRVIAWRVTALVTQKILVSRVVDEYLRLPAGILHDPDRRAAYEAALTAAVTVHGRLMRMMREARRQGPADHRTLAPPRSDRARAAGAVSQRAANLHFWARMSPVMEWATHLLDRGLTPQEALAANAQWQVAVQATARSAAHAGIEAAPFNGIGLADHAIALKGFMHGLETTTGTPFTATTTTIPEPPRD